MRVLGNRKPQSESDRREQPIRTLPVLRLIKSLSRTQKQAVMLTIDLALVPVALLFTLMVQRPGTDAMAELTSIWPVVGLLMVMAAAFSTILGIPNIRLNAYDMGSTGKTGLFAALLALAGLALGRTAGLGYSAGIYVVFGLAFFLFSVAARVVMLQTLLALSRRETPRRRVLIYGAGNTGMQLASALKTHETIDPVAFVDDNTALQGLTISGLPVLKPSRIQDIVLDRRIDRVLLAMPSVRLPKQTQIVRRLEKMGLEVQALPSFAQLIGEEELIDKLAPILPGQLLGRAQLDRRIGADEDHYAGRTVLVSGAGGSIGSELCRQVLACRPTRLVLYELSELALYTIDMELKALAEDTGTEVVSVLGSVTDARLVRKTLAAHEVDVVLHAAAYKHVPLVEENPLAGLANNVLGTATLARAAGEAGVERFILVSSDKAVRPTNVMGASKRLAELVVQDLAARSQGTVYAMVRFGNVLGSSGSVIPLFRDQIARGGPVTLTHPDVTRYFMTIQEAVRLVLRAGHFARGGEVFVLDMGAPVPIGKLARQVIEASGYTVRDEINPDGDIEIVVTGLRPGEKLHEELLIGEGFLTTGDEKIFTAREASLSEIEVASAIRSLREAVATADDTAARAVIARWVEGYPEPQEAQEGG
ncbi:MAG: nucleoside-diphosphate sugar epimerase/dehydratase [Rhodobacter sp.]|nr:nucleoside-diphosphate sugar epimerase/dehydratase [Rhodobacter sp.]